MTQIAFTANVWDRIKRTDETIAVGDMERLAELAEHTTDALIFDRHIWDDAKSSNATIAVGDMERLERYGAGGLLQPGDRVLVSICDDWAEAGVVLGNSVNTETRAELGLLAVELDRTIELPGNGGWMRIVDREPDELKFVAAS